MSRCGYVRAITRENQIHKSNECLPGHWVDEPFPGHSSLSSHFHTFGRQTCTVPSTLAEAIIVPSGDLASLKNVGAGLPKPTAQTGVFCVEAQYNYSHKQPSPFPSSLTCYKVPSQNISHHKSVLYPNAFRNAALAAL